MSTLSKALEQREEPKDTTKTHEFFRQAVNDIKKPAYRVPQPTKK